MTERRSGLILEVETEARIEWDTLFRNILQKNRRVVGAPMVYENSFSFDANPEVKFHVAVFPMALKFLHPRFTMVVIKRKDEFVMQGFAASEWEGDIPTVSEIRCIGDETPELSLSPAMIALLGQKTVIPDSERITHNTTGVQVIIPQSRNPIH